MASKSSSLLFLGWLLATIVFDQLTKWWIMNTFSPFESREVVPGAFNLVYVTNTGAAFGLLAGRESMLRQLLFVAISLAALVAILFAYRHFRREGGWAVSGLGLVAGGAVGNLIDRLRFGKVIDFLDFYIGSYHWPAFNVADAAITIGVACLLLSSFRTGAGSEKTT